MSAPMASHSSGWANARTSTSMPTETRKNGTNRVSAAKRIRLMSAPCSGMKRFSARPVTSAPMMGSIPRDCDSAHEPNSTTMVKTNSSDTSPPMRRKNQRDSRGTPTMTRAP